MIIIVSRISLDQHVLSFRPVFTLKWRSPSLPFSIIQLLRIEIVSFLTHYNWFKAASFLTQKLALLTCPVPRYGKWLHGEGQALDWYVWPYLISHSACVYNE